MGFSGTEGWYHLRMTSTARSLRAGFGALVGLLLLLGGARLAVGQLVALRVEPRVERATDAAQANVALLQALTDAESGLRGYQLTGDPSFLEPYRSGLARYATARATVRGAAGTEPLRSLVAAEIRAADAWLASTMPLADAAPGSADPRAASAVARDRTSFDRLRSANGRVTAEFDAARSASRDLARTITLVADVLTALALLLAAVFALVLGRRTRRLVAAPFEQVRTVLSRLRGGDRSARGDLTGSPRACDVVPALNELADDPEQLRSSESGRAVIRRQALDLGAEVRASLDPDAILDGVVAGLGGLLHVDHVYVRLADGGRPGTVDRLWSRPGRAQLPIEALRTVTTATPWPGRTVHAERTTSAGRTGAGWSLAADVLAVGDARACLLTGFTVDADVSGLLVLVRTEPGPAWTDDDRALIEAVAADTGRGLHVAQVYEHQRELAERFQDLDRQKTDFISTVSHELRTPLTSILGYLEILLSGDQGDLTEAQDRSLRVVERNAERLRELVGDLLTLSRIGSGNLEMTATRVQIATLVDGVRKEFAPVAAGAGLTLSGDADDDLAVIGDARQLERVLLDVVGNAVKFTPAGGSVRVTARAERIDRADRGEPGDRSGERVVIEVSDSGMGIPAGDQTKLFQPFQRASNAVASAVQGTGLGLAIARSIVERHGGEVTLRSAVGEGTTVTLTLPRALGTPDESEAAADPRAAAIRAAKARALSRSVAR